MMNYRNYEKEMKEEDAKKKVFAYEQFMQNRFTAMMIQDDENFLIFNWSGKYSKYLSTRYILDKKNGRLIIAGDTGVCIASWHKEVSAKDMEHLVDSTEYFISKITKSSDKYTYFCEDIVADFSR